jgi:hypothetical protein
VMRHFPHFEALVFPRRPFKAMASAFFPPGIDDNSYADAPEDGRSRYRAFLVRFWKAFDPDRRIDAVLTANFAYFAEQELAGALEELGVPFIALHKENSWTPGGKAFWERVHRERRRPFQGRRILVYNSSERETQIRGGIAEPEVIEVVGMPRLDPVHRWRAANAGSRPETAVLFASFLPHVGLPILPRKAHGDRKERYFEVLEEGADNLSVAELCLQTHRAIVGLAQANPEIRIWVKTKGHLRDMEVLHRLLGVTKPAELPPNMTIVHGGSPMDLLQRAAVVCGLHTTVLLEALAVGRPVVVPWFAEALDPSVSRYLFDLSPTVERASSPQDLFERLRSLALQRTPVPASLSTESRTVLRNWLGNDDGSAGERAAASIRQATAAGPTSRGN